MAAKSGQFTADEE